MTIPTALLVEMPEDSRPSVLAPEPVRAAVPAARLEPVAAASRPEPSRRPRGRSPSPPPYEPEPATAQPQPAERSGNRRQEELAPLPQRRRQSTRAASGSRPAGGGAQGSDGRLLTTPEEAQKRWGDFQIGAEAGRREALPTEQHDITEGN